MPEYVKDPHSILGVSKNAEKVEIKAAYRKLALRYHPDLTHGDEEKFKILTEAYETALRGTGYNEVPYTVSNRGYNVRSQAGRRNFSGRAPLFWGFGLALGCVLFGGALLLGRTEMYTHNLHRKGASRTIEPTRDTQKRERIAKILLGKSRVEQERNN